MHCAMQTRQNLFVLQAGTWFRAAFLANDRCSGEGPVWRPRTCCLLPHPPLDSRSHPLIPPSADEAPAIAAIEPRIPSVVSRPSIELTGQEQSSALAEGLVAEPSGHVSRVPNGNAVKSVGAEDEMTSQAEKQRDLGAGVVAADEMMSQAEKQSKSGAGGAAESAIQLPPAANTEGDKAAVDDTDVLAASLTQPLGSLHGRQANAVGENGPNVVGPSLPAVEAGRSSVAAEGVHKPMQERPSLMGTGGAPDVSDQESLMAGNLGSASDLPSRSLDSSAEAARSDAAHLVAGSGDGTAALEAVPAIFNDELAGRSQDDIKSRSAQPLVMAGATGGVNLMCVPSRGSSLPGSGRWALQNKDTGVAHDLPAAILSSILHRSTVFNP